VFLKEVRAELKKVKWPTRSEVIKMTAIVLGVSTVVGAFIAGLDYLLTNLMGLIIK
jgi:preprotein translocase subunit SecE